MAVFSFVAKCRIMSKIVVRCRRLSQIVACLQFSIELRCNWHKVHFDKTFSKLIHYIRAEAGAKVLAFRL